MKSRRAFTKFLQKPQHRVSCTEIPADLANDILEKELEIEKTATLKLINELIALYTKAIEHYETQENPKYIDFQERMHKMLVKPEIFIVIKQGNEKFPNEDNEKYENVREERKDIGSFLENRKEKAEEMRKTFASQLNSALLASKNMGSLKTLLAEHSSSTESASHSAISELKVQEQSLEQKLKARKSSVRPRTAAPNKHSRNFSSIICDISDLDQDISSSTKSSLCTNEENKEIFERYEKRLEEIIEKNLEEREIKILEIKFKYETEINELAENGEIMQMVANELKKNMRREIEEIVEKYDIKRKNEIKKLKEEVYN